MFEKLEKGLRVFNHFSILTGIEKIGKNEVGVVESKLYNTGQIVDSIYKRIKVHSSSFYATAKIYQKCSKIIF